MSISASMEPSAFSEDGKYYSQIGSDGRCKIWDTETNILKQEFIPDLHLSAPLSCLYWIQLDGGTLNPKWKSRKRKSSIPEDENERQITHCIAFGSTSGKVLIYSLTHAKVESVLEDANTTQGEQDICCMDWSKKNGLFTCSLDSTIRQWSIEDGLVKINFKMSKFEKGTRNSKTTAIKVPQSPITVGRRLLLTASGQLRLWCLDSRTVLRTMVGHAGDVCHLDIVSFTKDGRYLDIISGSKTDRILSLWKVTLESDELEAVADDMPESRKAKRRSRTKSGGGDTPTTETRPSCNFLMEDMARQVSCRAEGGRSEVKLCAVTRRGVVHYYEHILNGMSSKPIKPSTTIQVVSEEKNQVKLAAAVCGTLRGDSLLVGYSSGTGIKFEKITPDTSEKTQVLIRTLKEKETRKESQKTRAEEITGIREGDSHDASVVYLPSALARADHSLKRKLGSKQVDIPMEMRLANLSLAQTGKGQAPETKNMAQLLVQALHSKDSKLLQTVFACTEPEVAHNTVNRLPLQYLPGLLEHLTTMLAGKTNQCKSCCVWTAALCQVRSAALLQQQGLAPVLAAAEARAPSLPRLLALRSRLSLLAASKTPAEEHPVLEYRDSSSEDEADDDMEEALLNGGDANDDSGSWNELEDEDEGLSSDQMSQ